MKRKVHLVVPLLVLISGSVLGADALLVEWADRSTNPKWMPGEPIFQRTLYCWQGTEDCELTVLTISRFSCPLHLSAETFRTETGSLTVGRSGNSLRLEFNDAFSRWDVRVELSKGDSPIVVRASGAVVTTPAKSGAALRTSEISALAKDTLGLSVREFVEVDLRCTRVAVVAAKQEAKN
jgi:hypothetical protein